MPCCSDIDAPAAWALLWEAPDGALRSVEPGDFLSAHSGQTGEGEAREFVWRGHPELGPDFTVTVHWRPAEDGLFRGEFAYAGHDGTGRIAEIHFPVVRRPHGPESRVAAGYFDMGALLKCPPGAVKRENYRSMQFCALLSPDGDNYYIDHRDPDWRSKFAELRVSKDGAEWEYRGVYLPPRPAAPPPAFDLPYPSTVGTFKGGWYEAARIYRAWSLGQSRSAAAAAVNPLRDIGLWVWNRGLSGQVVPPVERLQADLPGIRVALDWYWWHHNPYDTDYPDFWPPREGVEVFRDAVRRLTGRGVFAQVYINGLCWDMDGPSFAEGGADEIVVQADGTPLNFAFNVYNRHRLGYMCGEAPRFQDRISRLVGELRASGLSGQYLDQIGCCTTLPCHNPAHAHPPGDDLACLMGFRRLLTRLRAENPGFALTTETANEPYMDLCDGGIICYSAGIERYTHPAGEDPPEPVPMFTAVHHGRFALFGSYAIPDGVTAWDPLWPPEDRWRVEKPWHRLYPDQFFVELARAVVWGAQPMVCNLHAGIQDDPEFAGHYRFILDTARFYHANRDLLFDGEMLSPDGFVCEHGPVDFLGRSIFTRENDCPVRRRVMPRVLHGAWKSPDGRAALVLANYTAQAQGWRFRDREGIAPPHSYQRIPLD